MLADLIRRALEFEGFRVTQVMNITDVGHMTDESSPEAVDKMLLAMEDEGLSPAEIAQKYTEAVFADEALLGIRPADRYPEGDRAHPRDDRAHADARRQRPRVRRGLRQRVLRRHVVPRIRQALGQHPGQPARGTPGPRDRPQQASRRRLRAVEGGRPRPRHEMGLAVGRGLPRVARGVLGDVHEVPGRAFRHPHGRHRPAIPPSRGRDRAVRGRRGAPGRRHLGPRGAPPPGGTEDREVHGQRRPRAGAPGTRDGPLELPLAHVPDPVPQRDGLRLGRRWRTPTAG